MTNRYLNMCKKSWQYLNRDIRIDDYIMVKNSKVPVRCVGVHRLRGQYLDETPKYQYLEEDAISKYSRWANNLHIYYGFKEDTYIIWTQKQLQEMLSVRSNDGIKNTDLLRLKFLHTWIHTLLDKKQYYSKAFLLNLSIEEMWLCLIMYLKNKVWSNSHGGYWRKMTYTKRLSLYLLKPEEAIEKTFKYVKINQ